MCYVYHMATNKYPATCAECGARVPAGSGRLVTKIGKTWLVNCAAHPAPAARRRHPDDTDDGYDAIKDRALENGLRW